MCPQGCGGSNPPFGTSYLRDQLLRRVLTGRCCLLSFCCRPLSSDRDLRDSRLRYDGRRLALGRRHLVAEMVGREVRVAEGHLDVRVAEDRLERLEPAAPHHEPRSERVPEIVEP